MPSMVKRRSCPYDLRKRVLINNFLKTQMKVEVENIPEKHKQSETNEEMMVEPESTVQKVLRSLSCRLRSTCSKKVAQHIKIKSRRRTLASFGSRQSDSQESLLSSPETEETNKFERRVSARSIASKLSVSNLRSSWNQRYMPIPSSPLQPSTKWTRSQQPTSDSVKKVSTNASPIRRSRLSSKRPSFRKALMNFVSSSASEDIVAYPSSVEYTVTPKTSFLTKMFRNFSVKDNTSVRRTAGVSRSRSIYASPNRIPPLLRPPRRAHSMRISMTKLR